LPVIFALQSAPACYNTEQDRIDARTKGIKVIGLSEFLLN
jgi:hypothetical protein